MRKGKRLLSLLLALCLTLGLLPAVALPVQAAPIPGSARIVTGTLKGGQTLTDNTIYMVLENTTVTGANATASTGAESGLVVASGASVAIYIAEGVTLTVKGGNGLGTWGGGAGIEVPSNATLAVIGKGTLNATGGSGGSATSGATGQQGEINWNGSPYDALRFIFLNWRPSSGWDGTGNPGGSQSGGNGGAGGNGAGAPGAGIGGRGGNGGSGGTGGQGAGAVLLGERVEDVSNFEPERTLHAYSFFNVSHKDKASDDKETTGDSLWRNDITGDSGAGGAGGSGGDGGTMGSYYFAPGVRVNAAAGANSETGGGKGDTYKASTAATGLPNKMTSGRRDSAISFAMRVDLWNRGKTNVAAGPGGPGAGGGGSSPAANIGGGGGGGAGGGGGSGGGVAADDQGRDIKKLKKKMHLADYFNSGLGGGGGGGGRDAAGNRVGATGADASGSIPGAGDAITDYDDNNLRLLVSAGSGGSSGTGGKAGGSGTRLTTAPSIATFTLKLDPNGGEGGVQTVTEIFGSGPDAPAVTWPSLTGRGIEKPTKAGGQFVGYTMTADSASLLIYDKNLKTVSSHPTSNGQTLYAQYSGLHRVTYDLGGGTGTLPTDDREYLMYDSITPLDPIAFGRGLTKVIGGVGYSFSCWRVTYRGGTEGGYVLPGQAFRWARDEDLTLTAVYGRTTLKKDTLTTGTVPGGGGASTFLNFGTPSLSTGNTVYFLGSGAPTVTAASGGSSPTVNGNGVNIKYTQNQTAKLSGECTAYYTLTGSMAGGNYTYISNSFSGTVTVNTVNSGTSGTVSADLFGKAYSLLSIIAPATGTTTTSSAGGSISGSFTNPKVTVNGIQITAESAKFSNGSISTGGFYFSGLSGTTSVATNINEAYFRGITAESTRTNTVDAQLRLDLTTGSVAFLSPVTGASYAATESGGRYTLPTAPSATLSNTSKVLTLKDSTLATPTVVSAVKNRAGTAVTVKYSGVPTASLGGGTHYLAAAVVGSNGRVKQFGTVADCTDRGDGTVILDLTGLDLSDTGDQLYLVTYVDGGNYTTNSISKAVRVTPSEASASSDPESFPLVDMGQLTAGQTVNYSIDVRYTGEEGAHSGVITVTDTVPDGMTLVPGSVRTYVAASIDSDSPGTAADGVFLGTPTVNGNTLTFQVYGLRQGYYLRVTFDAKAPATLPGAYTEYLNTARYTAGGAAGVSNAVRHYVGTKPAGTRYPVTYIYDPTQSATAGTAPADPPALPGTVTYFEGRTVTLEEPFRLDGWELKWKVVSIQDSGDETEIIPVDGKFTMPPNAVNVVGTWRQVAIETVHICYQWAGVDGNERNKPQDTSALPSNWETRKNGAVVPLPDYPVATDDLTNDEAIENYVFRGWKLQTAQGVWSGDPATMSWTPALDAAPDLTQATPVNGHAMVTGLWDRKQFTVTYQYQNAPTGQTAPAPESLRWDDEFTAPAFPVVEGWVLDGWTDQVGNRYEPGKSYVMPTQDLTLTAVWKQQYKVAAWSGGEETAVMPRDKAGWDPGDTVTLPAAKTAEGLTFKGWKLVKTTGGADVTNALGLTETGGIYTLTMQNYDVTAIALYTARVTFSLYGGNWNAGAKSAVEVTVDGKTMQTTLGAGNFPTKDQASPDTPAFLPNTAAWYRERTATDPVWDPADKPDESDAYIKMSAPDAPGAATVITRDVTFLLKFTENRYVTVTYTAGPDSSARFTLNDRSTADLDVDDPDNPVEWVEDTIQESRYVGEDWTGVILDTSLGFRFYSEYDQSVFDTAGAGTKLSDWTKNGQTLAVSWDNSKTDGYYIFKEVTVNTPIADTQFYAHLLGLMFDYNTDGNVTGADLGVMRGLLTLPKLEADYLRLSDVNGDGIVNSLDLSILRMCLNNRTMRSWLREN